MPLRSAHARTALRISLRRSDASDSSFLWRSMKRSRTIPLTIPIAERTATVPRMFSQSVITLPTCPAGTTSP